MKRILLSFGLLACWFGVQAQCPGLSPATLPFTEDFESYSGPIEPSTGDTVFNCSSTYKWEFQRDTTYGRLSFTADAYSGSQAAVMDVNDNLEWDTNATTLTINLTGYTSSTNDIILSFWYKDNGDEVHAEDKVWLRGSDSDNWIEILDWNSTANGSNWTLARFKMDSILSANSQSFSATTQVRWGQRDNYTYGSDGFAFDEVSIVEATCPQPTAISVSNITANSVQLNWTSGGATNWQISYDTTGNGYGANLTHITSAPPYTITGLEQGVTYDFFVRDSCGANDLSFWTMPVSASLNCGGYSAPYSNNFDQEATNDVATCWNQYTNHSFADAEVSTGGSPRSGSQQLAFYTSSATAADTLLAISPQFSDITAGDKQLRFFAKTTEVDDTLFVGTIANPVPSASFHSIDTIVFDADDTYEEVIIELTTANGYNGTDQYVVLAHSLSTTYDYIYVDDFNYEAIPACPKPIGLVVNSVSDTSATISFDARGNSGGYEFQFGPPGFSQGTATTYTATSNPFTFDGLFGNFEYEIYVRNNCGANGSSAWSQPITFTTDCSAFNGPFFTDFESDELDEVPDCWSYYESYSAAWIEVEDYGTAYSGDQALVMYNSGSSTTGGDTIMAISPEFDDLTDGDRQIRFYAQSSNVSSDLIVGTLPTQNGQSQFTPIDTIDFTTADTYLEYAVLIDAANGYNGTDKYIAFLHGAGTTYDYIHIDDLNYEQQPQCLPTQASDISVLNVTNDSVFLNWIPGDGAKFKVEVGPAGFTPGSGLFEISTADTFAGFSGLTSVTTYDVYITDSCNSGYSPAAGPIAFTTDCGIFTAPLTEDFDGWGLSNDSISYCWARTGNSSFDWEIEDASTTSSNTGPDADYSGTGNYVYTEASSGSEGDTARLTSAMIDVSNLNQVEVAFFYHMYGGDMGSLFIEINDGTQTFSSLGTINGEQQASSTDAYLPFVFNAAALPLASDTITISICGIRGAGYESDIAIDAFEVREATTCPTVGQFTLDGATTTSATFSWLSGTNLSNLNWGPTGFQQGSGAGSFVRGITSPQTITGLTPNTTYDIYVQDSCATGGNGAWIGPITFRTPCTAALAGGTYSIGGPTADFATFDSVATVLNGCGITGPVVFNIQAGSYTDQLHLARVAGVSKTNTITFNGSGSDTLIWNQQGEQAAVLLDSVPYVTFNNMRIENTSGSEAWGILVSNHSDSVTIDSCVVIVDSTSTSGDISPILISSDFENDLGEDAFVDYLTVTNSTLIGGYYGLALEGNGTDNFGVGHIVSDNTIMAFYNAGVYTDDVADFVISNNNIHTTRSSADGIYLLDVNNFTIESNTVNVTDYGLYVLDGNDGAVVTANSNLINNMVRSTDDYGIYLNDVEKVNVYHNTAMGEPGMRLNDQDTVDIRNNIFASTGDYAFESTDSILPVEVMDYNLFYRSDNGDPIYVDGSAYTDLAAFQATYSALNANSVEGNPFFLSASDLHVLGALANEAGDNSVPVNVDIDGDSRPGAGATNVDIGADEFEPVGDDIGVVSIMQPANYNCGDSNTVVSVLVRNFGTNTASNFTVSGNVSGAGTATLTGTYSGSLTSLQADTVVLSTFNAVAGGQYTIEAYTSLSGDTIANNDTAMVSVNLNNSLPITITASDSAFCTPQAVTLWADTTYSGLPYVWKDINDNQLGTGDTLMLSNVDSTTTVVLEIDTANSIPPFGVGPKDTTIGSAGSFSSLDAQSLIVEAYQQVVIDNVKIYPQQSGMMTVELRDTANGTVVSSVVVPVTQNGNSYEPVRVALGLSVPVGTYELGVNDSSSIGALLRNSTGAVFPYGDANIFEVLTQTFGLNSSNQSYQDYYYYFYDMVVSGGSGCPRPASQFTINYGSGSLAASFTSTVVSVTASDATVDFDGTASAPNVTTYEWDFGDGTTDVGATPQHVYSSNGTYTVQLIVTNSCDKDTLEQQVVIEGISLEENALSRSLSVYPNPTADNIQLSFDSDGAQSATIQLMDLSGRLVKSVKAEQLNGSYSTELQLSELADGVYMLRISAGDLNAARRIIKQ